MVPGTLPAKMLTEQLKRGRKYSLIKKVVSIIITGYPLTQLAGSGRYHHQFRYRTGDGIEFTDLVEVNTLELPKLPRKTDNTDLWNWITNEERRMKNEKSKKAPFFLFSLFILHL